MTIPVHEALRTRRDAIVAMRAATVSGKDVMQRPWFTEANMASAPMAVASADFGRYVAAMAVQWPEREYLRWPLMEECRWPFPDQGILFVWEEPYENEIWINSDRDGRPVPYGFNVRTRATFILDPWHTVQPAAMMPNGTRAHLPHAVSFTVHLHEDDSITTGYWMWGGGVRQHDEEDRGAPISKNARFDRALIEAIGHRLSVLSARGPATMTRPERRAVERSGMGEYRLLDLHTPLRAIERSADPDEHHVEWTKRWMVRGHWRNQAYGPAWGERRVQWIDPFIKGPDDKPLDIRPDLFKLDK